MRFRGGARTNVRIVLDVRGEGTGSSMTKASNALAAVGLAHKATSFPRELSGGEQQRVAIARAMVGDPSIILADEPTGALDSENGQAVMMLLAQTAKNPSRSVLVVTHDPRTLRFANPIVHIEDGRIIVDEPAGEAPRLNRKRVSNMWLSRRFQDAREP